ncbi:MAG TPA: hydrolase [Gemmatimonadaceae bacterium]|jgi:nicotinamidase-related amidase|nr:hydrolase [Gemmatimonadaceae bacterium]
MTAISLDPKKTALVVIDLQKGIVAMETVPHPTADVVSRSANVAKYFRAHGALVVWVNVETGPDGILFPRAITDVERPRMSMPADWSQLAPELGVEPSDVRVTKHQPSAFFGTDLDIQLRRRGIDTIVLTGISTNMGVESTARTGIEMGYNLVFVEDAMAGRDAEHHAIVARKYFPTIGRVRSADELLRAFEA